MISTEYHSLVLFLLLLSLFIITFLAYKLKRNNDQLLLSQSELKQAFEANVLLQSTLTPLLGIEEKNENLNQQLFEFHSLKGSLEQVESLVTQLQLQLLSKDDELVILRESYHQSEIRSSELSTELSMEKSNSEEKLQILVAAKAQLANEFEVLANQIFENKQSQFTQTTQETMDAILKPMRSSLDAFKQRVELVHKEDIEGRTSLAEQLKHLQALNQQMSEDTHNLTHALKGDSKIQGNWGELILERLLERSGLTEGVEFDREKSFTDQSGKRLRPDVILNLPDNKHIVIDSKVSLLHYEQSLNSNDERQRSTALKAHLQSLRTHIDTLANKRYEFLEQLNAPDFVLMFVPVEGAYLMAIEADASVFEDAFQKRVAVVTPTTLFTSLKTIEQLWRYERQSENTLKLIKRAAEVHDKFVGFVESFEKVGKQLQTTQNTYDSARSQMIQGKGNLIRQAEMLKELAGKTKKELPSHLIDEANSACKQVAE